MNLSRYDLPHDGRTHSTSCLAPVFNIKLNATSDIQAGYRLTYSVMPFLTITLLPIMPAILHKPAAMEMERPSHTRGLRQLQIWRPCDRPVLQHEWQLLQTLHQAVRQLADKRYTPTPN